MMITALSRRHALALSAALLLGAPAAAQAQTTLLNVSYDPTRELYQEFNAAFAKHWKRRTAKPYRSSSRMADPASRPAPSSTASKPTW